MEVDSAAAQPAGIKSRWLIEEEEEEQPPALSANGTVSFPISHYHHTILAADFLASHLIVAQPAQSAMNSGPVQRPTDSHLLSTADC